MSHFGDLSNSQITFVFTFYSFQIYKILKQIIVLLKTKQYMELSLSQWFWWATLKPKQKQKTNRFWKKKNSNNQVFYSSMKFASKSFLKKFLKKLFLQRLKVNCRKTFKWYLFLYSMYLHSYILTYPILGTTYSKWCRNSKPLDK